MNDKVNKLLVDILEAIDNIDNFVSYPRMFTGYQDDTKTKSAVERQLGIIGEAVNKILKINPQISIVHAKDIVNMRNRIIHAYDSVDDEIIWAIIINHLPVLKIEVNSILAEK